MREAIRRETTARTAVTVGALLPYWRLLTLSVVYVTDDYFASDIFNGELPGRVLIGRLIRHRQLPVWSSQLCSGLPLAGSPADPIGLAAFTFLPAAPALDIYVIVLLLIAAHGAYTLARQFGAGRAGAVLAAVAFSGSGYIACQLKHLAIVSTVVWLPLGLVVLDRIFQPPSASNAGPASTSRVARRSRAVPLFGLIVAEQVLCGFPQSAYYCALVYCAFALFHVAQASSRDRGIRGIVPSAGSVAVAAALGAAAGAVVLVPLWALAAVSDRTAAGWEWVSRLRYWPPNAVTFLLPYFNGDISNNSYVGPPFFWEDYGYVGAAVFVLAIYGAVRERRRPVALFTLLMTLVAYLMVLGPASPVFHAAFVLVPGISVFRFPTRFLIVVELGLAVLAAFGLTSFCEDLARVIKVRSRVPAFAAVALCAGTVLDLYGHQPRQNPMVPAREWLAAPQTVSLMQQDTPQPRTFTPRHRDLHREAFEEADGWANVQPYFALRDVLEPNTGAGFWNTASADCYAGISARWSVDVWGDHNREESVMADLTLPDEDAQVLRIAPQVPTLLKTYGVTHLLSPYEVQGAPLGSARRAGPAFIYTVPGAARVRLVRAARVAGSERDAVADLLSADFDPNLEIVLDEAAGPVHPTVNDIGTRADAGVPSHVSITYEDSTRLLIDADAPADGFLLVADTFYPGWTARVDGAATPIYRADLSIRGIRLPKGHHDVRFTYDPPGFTVGLAATGCATAALLLWLAGAAYVDLRTLTS